MGRRAQGWRLRKSGNTYYIRFTHGGRTRELSTGTGDLGEASRIAPDKYAEVVTGRRVAKISAAGFDILIARWLLEYRKDHEPGTTETVTMYARAHWIPFFEDVSRITKDSIADYVRARLTQVTRTTVRKELSGLRQLCEWLTLDVVVPGLPRHGFPGKRHKQARKPRALVLPAATVERIVEAVEPKYRAFFRVLWETALRQSTLFRLRAPTHYVRGSDHLFISRDINKAHVETDLALSLPARRALELVAPASGIIFRRFNPRYVLARACIAAGAPTISPYDIRHSRLSAWANSGAPLPGVQGAALHASLATTARYVQPSKQATDFVILGGITGGLGAKEGV